MHKIFVSIAAYRDPELKPTLWSMLDNANDPSNLVICIAWQHSEEDEWDELNEFKKDSRFKILDLDYRESKGVCWARNLIQKEYTNEEYYLQLDSHHRFQKGWDTTLKDWLNYLKCTGHKKPILSAYLPSYDPIRDPDSRLNEVWTLNIDRFLPEGAVFLSPHLLHGWQELEEPVKSRFISAHFLFTVGQFAKEVPYDPDLYFHGEETSIAVRAYTHGYDLYSPHKPIIWHEYTRDGKKKHWDDDSTWSERDRNSYARFRKLFGMEGDCSPCSQRAMRPYNFGSERSLEDYERYAGLKFSTRQIHEETKRNELPPIKGDYDSGLAIWQKHFVDVYKGSLHENDYDFWVVSFLDENGEDLYRQDADENEINRLASENPKDHFIHICREYQHPIKPISWRVWPHSKSKGWCEIIENKIRYE